MKQPSVYLVGGGEFSATTEPADRRVLDVLDGSRVAIVPTAAAQQRPDLAALNGVSHFSRLGGDAEAVMILSEEDAQKPELCSMLVDADLIYLTGGDPAHLVKVFQGSTALKELRGAAERGAIVGGSSAGAMALGPVIAFPRQGTGEGLEVVKVVTIPHAESIPQVRLDEIADTAGADHSIVAIPSQSSCLLSGARLECFGPEAIAVYDGATWRSVAPNTGTLLSG